MLERLFQLHERGTTVGREVLGGAVTFMALSYIIFVQPAIMSMAGTKDNPLDFGAIMFATCVASAFACMLMGLLANLPVALAPAMGHNVLFAFTICGAATMGGFGLTWQQALAANFIAGALFLVMSLVGFRQAIIAALPESLKYAIAVGIGLLIAMVGLQYGQIVVGNPATLVDLSTLRTPVAQLTLFGLIVTATLMARRVHGAILIGIVATAVAAWVATELSVRGIIGEMPYRLIAPLGHAPPLNPGHTFLKLDFGGLFGHPALTCLAVIVIFFMLDLFDTIGTLIGVTERGGLLVDGKIPRVGRALFSDAAGTVVGTCLGTSTVTAYIESTSGISAGARTGLASIVTGALLLLALPAYPLVHAIGSGVNVAATGPPVFKYPIIAPTLILIGCMMMPAVRKVDWDDLTEAIPAFLCMVVMQFAFSIAAGIAWGFIAYALLKLVTGRAKDAHPFVYVFAALFVVMYALKWMPGTAV
ncbi:MAG: NCS2 family permease [Phycisphaerae bacterium]|nr:NCS2 family permease [Phycisphaerae bacterium]